MKAKIVNTTVMIMTMVSAQEIVETFDGNVIEVWDTGQSLILDFVNPDKKDMEIIIDKSSNNNRHTFKNNGQIRKDITEREELTATGLFGPLRKIGRLCNKTQSDSLALSRGRIRQDKPR